MQSQELPVEVRVQAQAAQVVALACRLARLAVLFVVLYVISRLEPDQAKRYGPLIESVYRVFNPPIEIELPKPASSSLPKSRAWAVKRGRIQPNAVFRADARR